MMHFAFLHLQTSYTYSTSTTLVRDCSPPGGQATVGLRAATVILSLQYLSSPQRVLICAKTAILARDTACLGQPCLPPCCGLAGHWTMLWLNLPATDHYSRSIPSSLTITHSTTGLDHMSAVTTMFLSHSSTDL